MSDSTFLCLRREQRTFAYSAKIYGSTTNFSFFNYQTFAHRYVAYGKKFSSCPPVFIICTSFSFGLKSFADEKPFNFLKQIYFLKSCSFPEFGFERYLLYFTYLLYSLTLLLQVVLDYSEPPNKLPCSLNLFLEFFPYTFTFSCKVHTF